MTTAMYAIIDINGKQYKVEEGKYLAVDLMDKEPGTSLSFDNVLMISDGSKSTLGKPTISGANVSATVKDHIKDKKIIVYKMRRKKGYRRKQGHRQKYTRITIDRITA
jgi:large subunit ribosomal protein L21